MKNGVTETGFEYEFDERNLDDMRFVDILTVVVDDNSSILDKLSGISKLLTMLLGDEQKKRLYEHIGKSYDGRVPREALENALEQIMNGAGKDAEKNC